MSDVPDYDLPTEAIAQHPVQPRDSARLLVALGGKVAHRHVSDLPELVGEGDVIVVNTSRVVPARLRLHRAGGGAAEVLLLEPGEGGTWEALVRPGRRLPPGTVLFAGARADAGADAGARGTASGPASATRAGEPVVEVGERLDGGARRVRSLVPDLLSYGQMALPPYIRARLEDPERYQTVYSDQPGSVAAPTAGLHLTNAVLQRCRDRGALVTGVDLAVGLGTFRPIKEGRVEDHSMHSERYRVPTETWEACRQARRVVAVGTTVVRSLESAAATGLMEGRTELFITPGHRFGVVDVLLTNFHQPRSSLLVLLEAFTGPQWRDLYRLALGEGYRFLSFGDAMLVARAAPAAAR